MSLDESATPAELQEMLREQRENSSKLQQQVEAMKLQNELEAERMQQLQWETAIDTLKKAREQMAQEHEANMEKLKTMTPEKPNKGPSPAVGWLREELGKSSSHSSVPVTSHTEDNHDTHQKQTRLEELHKQHQEIQQEMADLLQPHPSTMATDTQGTTQALLLEQIRAALAPKEPAKDLNKALLKALITTQNKTTGTGGTSTLKPDVLNKLTGDTNLSMAEWLASLNRQEEGESEISRLLNKVEEESNCRSECRHTKMKSGMLDKSTTNIRHKEVWPQKNLGEDWAEEEIKFKQLKFEHLVAGETCTIETCSDPAQILGRLRLLRRIAYLKLRGIEWHLLRKMYAAILSSIETREYSWESNFDRFESILYRKVLTDRNTDREHRDTRPQEGRKRFCRDYNRPEGCPRNSPHTVWFRSGPAATKRTVFHYCAACLIRDKASREHPEGHADCPHKA